MIEYDYYDLFEKVLVEFNNHTKWDGARFGKIKTISNTKVGSVGQTFIEKLCSEFGTLCEFPLNLAGGRKTQSPWDIAIHDVKFELKTATLDTTNHFQFNHIRYHRPYEAVICLGVSPHDLHFGVWSKAEIATGKAGNLVTMEKGANASYKLTKAVKDLKLIKDFHEEIALFVENFRKT